MGGQSPRLPQPGVVVVPGRLLTRRPVGFHCRPPPRSPSYQSTRREIVARRPLRHTIILTANRTISRTAEGSARVRLRAHPVDVAACRSTRDKGRFSEPGRCARGHPADPWRGDDSHRGRDSGITDAGRARVADRRHPGAAVRVVSCPLESVAAGSGAGVINRPSTVSTTSADLVWTQPAGLRISVLRGE